MKFLVSILAGCFLPLAFAPFGQFWIAPVALAFLLWSWKEASLKQAFYSGLFFGFGFFFVGVSWVFISIHRFGDANIILAGFLTLLFISTLSVFFAAQGFVFALISKKAPQTISFLFVFPATLVFFEWLRSWIFTGFPWLLVGYSQTNSPLKGFAPIIGCLGISFLVALTAGLFVMLNLKRKNIIPCLFCILFIWVGGYFLGGVAWTKSVGKPIKVSLIQGNIPQSVKWESSQVFPTLTKYQLLTEAHWSSDIIVWPEAAVPLLKADADDYLNYLATKAKEHHAAIILGVPVAKDNLFYNAAIAMGDGDGVYYKRRLVPFGEFMPFEKYLRGLIRFFNLPMSDFSAGKMNQPLLIAHGIKIAPLICYEIAYADLLKKDLPAAQLFIVMSDDAWFGNSIAEPQHLQIAQMRALETGRYILMSTNDGMTAIIKPDGTIQKTIPQFQAGVLTGEVFAMEGNTLWARL